ncbi:long-chain fatty aldehyde decarbonylase [Bdellovibrio sp. ArHS]|uniref:long-chain fatty aldehyde decarbonylase n=1 Tax=Bdellovibrio sp. ArHS TaxID=1569284 RepID=UPI0025BA0C36|nr:long-chain fatty aldehyde decarbonylase [Bdellovibrio sp. ArHS]
MTKTLNSFFQSICHSERLEAIFLLSMADHERLAGDQIRANISAKTPAGLVAEIEAHAEDEYRHGRQLEQLAIQILGSDLSLQEKNKLHKINEVMRSFVVGYFSNPHLIEAVNKHVAYVHGALTIEQFPFQVYSAYLSHTKLDWVRETINAIVADEHDHIRFGRTMLNQLPEENKLDLPELHRIEKDMCKRLFQRLTAIFNETSSESSDLHDEFLQSLDSDVRSRTAWVYAVGCAEKHAALATYKYFEECQAQAPDFMDQHLQDEIRHQKILHRSVSLGRYTLRANPVYNFLQEKMCTQMLRYQNKIFAKVKQQVSEPELVYFYSTTLIEMRVFKHYSKLAATTSDILVSHVLGRILDDEKDHAQLFHRNLVQHPSYDEAYFAELREFERRCFERVMFAMMPHLKSLLPDAILASGAEDQREVASVL